MKLHGCSRHSRAEGNDNTHNWDVMFIVKKIKGSNKKAIKQDKLDFICLKSCTEL